MFKWQLINNDVNKVLISVGLGDSFATFTRPNNHLIIEAKTTEARQKILSVLCGCGYDVIENDDWCGGLRLGIIIPDWNKEYRGLNWYSVHLVQHFLKCHNTQYTFEEIVQAAIRLHEKDYLHTMEDCVMMVTDNIINGNYLLP